MFGNGRRVCLVLCLLPVIERGREQVDAREVDEEAARVVHIGFLL